MYYLYLRPLVGSTVISIPLQIFDMAVAATYVEYGHPREYEDVWNTLFSDLALLNVRRGQGIYFSLVGLVGELKRPIVPRERYLTLIVSYYGAIGFTELTLLEFVSFIREPYELNMEDFEIRFPELSIVLNISNFIFGSKDQRLIFATDPERLFQKYTRLGGSFSFLWTRVNTYGEVVENYSKGNDSEPITQCEWGYGLQLTIAGEMQDFNIIKLLPQYEKSDIS